MQYSPPKKPQQNNTLNVYICRDPCPLPAFTQFLIILLCLGRFGASAILETDRCMLSRCRLVARQKDTTINFAFCVKRQQPNPAYHPFEME